MDPIAAYFWEGCGQGELRYQRCARCEAAQFYPRPFCARCGHAAPEWRVSAGHGTIYTATEIIRAPTPDFAQLVPYTLVLVDLDEGIRVMGHGTPDLGIGERVVLSFRAHSGKALPYFEKA